LSGIELEIPQGELFGIVGPDGAGKSTMMRLAMGLIRADRGEVRLLSGDPRSTRTSAGYVPQRFSLYPNLTVEENLRLYGAIYGTDPTEIERRSRESLEKMELWKFRERLTGNLSGGMKQKLALAVGMIHKPVALLLDEPTTGVDPLARREFWAMLYELHSQGVTIIVSTPYMDEAELCADLIFLNKGGILMRGSPGEMVKRYRHSLLDVAAPSRDAGEIILGVKGVLGVNLFGTRYHVETDDAEAASAAIGNALEDAGFPSVPIEKISPSLEDIFVSFASERES
jgi:ABC-2 type transport system ATP-binding protein